MCLVVLTYKPKYGDYIVWPKNLDLEKDVTEEDKITSSKIGEKLGISAEKVNQYLKELAWLENGKGGKLLTLEGKKHGGYQMETKEGIPYVMWNDDILQNEHFLRTKKIGQGELIEDFQETGEPISDDWRSKYKADIRTSDGHYVRSRAEMLIDNFLYYHRIIHAYERKVNIDEALFCDFYIPEQKVFIEFWGMEENKKYAERKKRKQELYLKYGFNLIEINDSDMGNLDEILTIKLRKFNVKVEYM